jgi:NADH-quinone oxidoreductase subunit E
MDQITVTPLGVNQAPEMGSAAVVLIDDVESMREGCRQTLEEEGLQTAVARDGLEGLQLVESLRPKVVLVDLKMPGISGIEVLEKIPEIDPAIVPIVLTGYGTIDSAVESMKIGAFDFLTKPFEPEKLVETVRRGMELSQLRYDSSDALMEAPKEKLTQEEVLDKQDVLLKGLSAISEGYSIGLDQSQFIGELKRLESEAKYHARSLGNVKDRERAILAIYNDLRMVDEIIRKHDYKKNNLIQILLETQQKLNWLPGHVLKWISGRLHIFLAEIYNIASFYEAFSLEPQGAHIVKVCTGTACHVRGAPNLLKKVSSILDIQENETDTNQMFTLKTVNCLGCCALSPVLQVDETYSSNPSLTKLKKMFNSLEEQEDCR